MARGRGRGTAADPVETFGEGTLPSVAMVCGEERFLVERAVATIRRRLGVQEDPDRGRTVWGDDPPERLLAAIDELGAPGLFGGVSLVVVRRAEALKGAVEDRVLALMEGAPLAGHLLLVAGAPDKRRKLFQRLLKAAGHEYGGVSDRAELNGWIGRLARERGIRVESAAAEALVERCGGALGVLDSELEKLALMGERVSLDDVRRMVPATRLHGIDELTSCLAAGDTRGSIGALRSLLREGEAVPRIVAFVAGNVRRALHVAELAEAGLSDAAIAERLKAPAWLIRKQRGRGRATHLERALGVLAGLDRALKRSRAPDAAVEAAIAELTSPTRSSGARRPG